MPRKGVIARKLRDMLRLSPKMYRKLVVRLSDTVEQKMCANLWKEIDYSHVPSVAHSRLRKAFNRHDPEGYTQYIESVQKGDKKINASAIFPHDVIAKVNIKPWGNIAQITGTERNSIIAQWDSLPDYISGNESIIPVIDVSGSMVTPVSGNITAMDVAVSLGLYTSERLKGPFKDHFITFSSKPQIQHLSGDIVTRLESCVKSEWGMSTNLVRVFSQILSKAKQYNLSQDDMPSKVIIFSDMEFDQAINNGDATAFVAIDKLYEQAGYTRPQLVFWNITGRSNSNTPVKIHDGGTALVSGFSPSILSSIMGGNLNPLSVVLKTIEKERYDH